MNSRPAQRIVAVCAVIALTNTSAWGQACRFARNLDPYLNIFSDASLVSKDGTVLVGRRGNSEEETAVRWTAADGFQHIRSMTGQKSEIHAISDDGSVLVGHAFNEHTGEVNALRWNVNEGSENLGVLPGGRASCAYSTSADGSVLAGYCTIGFNHRPIRWTREDGMQDLGTLGGNSARAVVVSADGKVITGYSYTANGGIIDHTFRWTAETGMQNLGTVNGKDTVPIVISADGSTIFGTWDTYRCFRWTEEHGMQNFNAVVGTNLQMIPTAISADGSVLVGRIQGSSSWRPFRWTKDGGLLYLSESAGSATGVSSDGSAMSGNANGPFRWTIDNGFQLLPKVGKGFRSSVAWAISADGTTVVGSMQNEVGRLTMCVWYETTADFDGSNFVDTDDFTAYVQAFESGDGNADFDRSGFVDTDDFSAFVTAFEAGC